MNTFYITLPSNSSKKLFPGNTAANYKTQLTHPIDLTGDWEVGLAEIQYMHTWYTIKDERIRVGTQMYKLDRYYETFTKLCEKLNKDIQERQQPGETCPVKFLYDTYIRKIKIRNPDQIAIKIPRNVCYLFGFEISNNQKELTVTDCKKKSDYIPDLKQGMYALYVYCDLVSPHMVGDVKVPLLRIVPIEKGDIITKTYEHVQYFPVMIKRFHTVEIDIKDDTNQSVSFNGGKSTVTLHFRKKQSS